MNKFSSFTPILIQASELNIQFISIFFILSLIYLAILDLKTRLIPDRYILISALLAYLLSILLRHQEAPLSLHLLASPILAGLSCSAPFILLFFLRDDIGGADSKLAFICGLYAGIEKGFKILLLGSLFSALIFTLFYLIKKKSWSKEKLKTYPYPLFPGICLFLCIDLLVITSLLH